MEIHIKILFGYLVIFGTVSLYNCSNSNDLVSPPDDDPIELNANIKVGNVLIVNLLNIDKNLKKNGKKKPFDL